LLIRSDGKMAVRKTVALIVFAVVAASMVSIVLAVRQTSRPVKNNGVVTALNVGIYQNVDCTETLSNVSWGTVASGTSSNMTVYIRNSGDAAVVLNMTLASWNPIAASSCLTCTWNREGFTLKPKNKVQAVLVLSVSDGTVNVTDFSFVTIISGTEV
jgi:hypothetical protein